MELRDSRPYLQELSSNSYPNSQLIPISLVDKCLTEGQSLPTNHWSHVYLSGERDECSSSQFMGEMWSAHHVLQQLLAFQAKYMFVCVCVPQNILLNAVPLRNDEIYFLLKMSSRGVINISRQTFESANQTLNFLHSREACKPLHF